MNQENPESYLEDLVVPIRIPTPFAVGDVFCYLIKDEKIVLVDTGPKQEEAREILEITFREHGIRLKDIEEIWLTHGHPDHFGLAAQLAEVSGAGLYGHRKERSNFSGDHDREHFKNFFEKHLVPQDHIEQMIKQLDWLAQYQDPVEPTWIKDGDKLETGQLSFAVKHAPGHAAGHLVFREDSGLIIGGDVLLEHISTNALINFDPDTGERNRSLLQYRESLRWMKQQTGLVLPGHGKQIRDISQKAGHHLMEQEERYGRIREMLDEQPRSLLRLSLEAFPFAIMKGDLFLVISEVLGYLDWGREDGVIEAFEIDGKLKYRTVN
ncbi:MAG: MBL fold metallo-hydrolase [Balneolaceae bacterium]|nr:MBL fold metallo-hydrolase [Balneolaceae bacterium]